MSSWKDLTSVLDNHRKNKKNKNDDKSPKKNSVNDNLNIENSNNHNNKISNARNNDVNMNKGLRKTQFSKSVSDVNNKKNKNKARNPTYLSAPTREQIREASNPKLKKSTSEKQLPVLNVHEDRTLKIPKNLQNKANPELRTCIRGSSIPNDSSSRNSKTMCADKAPKVSKCHDSKVTEVPLSRRRRGVPLWRKLLSKSDNSLSTRQDASVVSTQDHSTIEAR